MGAQRSEDPPARLESGDAELVDALVDTAQCLICILDPQGRIVRFNELCERLTGYAEDEVVGRDIRGLFIPPEHVEAFGELLELVWETQSPSPRAGEWVTRDGGRVPVVWSNRPLLDAEGRPRLLVTAGVDLSGRDELHRQLEEQLDLAFRLAAEQGALRRVATLVAGGPEPDEVFRAVSAEAADLMGADAAGVLRFDGSLAHVVGRFEEADLVAFPVGGAISLEEDSAVARVHRGGRTARIDAYEEIDSEVAGRMREVGITSSVAAPITLHNRLWGAMVASTRAGQPPERWVEERLAEFAELVSLALAGADNRRQLLDSRERIVRASDDERRRLERNLHDGAQQRLVGLSILLRLARSRIEAGEVPADLLQQACEEVEAAIEDLRSLAQGLHPPLLTQAGVGVALRAVARRLPLAVEVHDEGERFPAEVEAALYYASAEALTNAVKHAEARKARIYLERRGAEVLLRVADDGRGGAVEGSDGSGLRGLRDRVEALRGTFELDSPPGCGTTITVRLPIRAAGEG